MINDNWTNPNRMKWTPDLKDFRLIEDSIIDPDTINWSDDSVYDYDEEYGPIIFPLDAIAEIKRRHQGRTIKDCCLRYGISINAIKDLFLNLNGDFSKPDLSHKLILIVVNTVINTTAAVDLIDYMFGAVNIESQVEYQLSDLNPNEFIITANNIAEYLDNLGTNQDDEIEATA